MPWRTSIGRRWKPAGGERARELAPDVGEVLNNLAWTLLVAPEEFRDATRSVALAEAAIRAGGPNAFDLNTLGVAQ